MKSAQDSLFYRGCYDSLLFEANSFFVGFYSLHKNYEHTYGQILNFVVCQVEENLLNYFELLTELISLYYYRVIFYEHYPINELK